jgi:hypothetical protein
MNERAHGSTRVVAPADLEQELEGRLAASRPPRRVWGRRAKRFALRGTLLFQVFIIVFTLMAPMGISAGAPSSDGGAATTEASSDDKGKGNDKDPGKPPAEDPTPAPEPDPTEAPAPEEPAATEAPAEDEGPTEAPAEEPAEAQAPAAAVAPATELTTEATTTTEGLGATPAPIEAYAPSGPPTISSDKADYAPGETVTLTGTNWAAGESVRIVVNDTIGQSWKRDVTVTASGEGEIVDVFALPSYFISNYDVTATGPTSGTATTTFTDLAIGTYDQCSNDDGDGYATGDTGCRWINGNLQANNSTYAEGDATVQRLWLTDFAPGSSHSVTFEYGTTKGGDHAYDYLTQWDWSENWITLADLCDDIDGCETATETTTGIGNDPLVPDTIEPNPGGRVFTARGGTLNSATQPALASGSYAADSETRITVSFTLPASGPMCETQQGETTCGIAIFFGAHVARTDQWTAHDGTTGAGSVEGSPYHVALEFVDGASVGQRDNQMQANTIVANGTIVIVKDAIPNDAQDFSFNLTNGGTVDEDFLLDDDADGTLPTSESFSVPAGAYTAIEENIPAGWSLTNISCVDPTSNTSVNLGTATASINVASGETVTCTFTNTKGASLTIIKVTDPASDPQDFDFDLTGSGVPADLDLDTDGGDATLPSQQTFTLSAAQLGAKTITESAVAGWTLTNLVCSGDSESTTNLGTRTATVDIDAGEAVTCTYTNTKHASLTVIKVTDPASDPQDFDFDLTGAGVPADLDLDTDGGNADLPSQQTFNLNASQLGAHTVIESAVAGWTLTNLVCTGAGADSSTSLATATATLDIDAGETVVCTYTNTKHASLTIIKVTDPASDPQDFDFDLTGTGVGTDLDLDTDATSVGTPSQHTFDLNASQLGAKTVIESAVAGWTLTALVCTGAGADSSTSLATATATLDIDAGETVTCTFTNTKQGKVQVVKTQLGVTPPDASTFTFELRSGATTDTINPAPPPADAVLPGNPGTLLETQVANLGNSFSPEFATWLVPGDTYQLCEVTPASGWTIDFAGYTEFNLTIGGENIRVCIDFTVAAGEELSIAVDNTPPPGGDARTIGYWKNWTSCDGKGNQDPVLDDTLALSVVDFDGDGRVGIRIGDLDVDRCALAVDLLDKRAIGRAGDGFEDTDVGDGKKSASNAAFNLAAQLLAYRLNILAGAGDLPCANQAADDGQDLLDALGFNGYSLTISKANATLLTGYARTLDLYNNNELVCVP